MKIAVVSSTVFAVGAGGSALPGYGGLEIIAWQQAKGLAERGHAVTLFAPDGSSCPGCTVFPFGPAGQTDEKTAYGKYWQRLAEVECTIDHSWQKWCTVGQQEGWLKCPVLKWCHAPVNTMFQRLPEGIDKPCFVCISNDQQAHFEALFGRPCRRCYNGVDESFYAPLGVPRSNRYLFLARFSRVKSPDMAIAAAQSAGAGLDLVGDVVLTGEPEYLEECRRRCDGKQVRMVGPASRGECVHWFAQAQALLHPVHSFREPFGLTLVEAQAAQCPVIGWRYGAVPELVRHGETGFVVSTLAEMVELIKTDAVRSIDRQRCRAWVCDNFTVRHMVDRVEELCREAVETGGW